MSSEIPSSFSDEKLVAHVRDGSPQDFRLLVERYQQKLFSYVRSYIQDHSCSEDILQEAFIKMYININTFDCNKSFSAWAYKIAHNELINYIRKHKREITPKNETWVGEIADDRLSLEDELDTTFTKDGLHRAIRQLPMKYQEVIVLYYFYNKDHKEISEIVSSHPSTIATRISRAKDKLKRQLRKGDRQ